MLLLFSVLVVWWQEVPGGCQGPMAPSLQQTLRPRFREQLDFMASTFEIVNALLRELSVIALHTSGSVYKLSCFYGCARAVPCRFHLTPRLFRNLGERDCLVGGRVGVAGREGGGRGLEEAVLWSLIRSTRGKNLGNESMGVSDLGGFGRFKKVGLVWLLEWGSWVWR